MVVNVITVNLCHRRAFILCLNLILRPGKIHGCEVHVVNTVYALLLFQTAQQFNNMYESAINQSTEFNFTFVATLTYDAVWALSLALDSTAKMINSTLGEAEIRSLTGCNSPNGSGTLVPLSEFEYSNALMGCVIRWNLHRVAFQGVSVSICLATCSSGLV